MSDLRQDSAHQTNKEMKNELRDRYNALYSHMATSSNPSYMKTFGAVLTEMMDWMIANKPEEAKEWVDKLESIKWHNYLTTKEAEEIVEDMEPKAPWSRAEWVKAMDSLGLDTERWPQYNRCALWTTMSMIHSDSSKTLAGIIGGDTRSAEPEEMLRAIYALAVDKLTDEDGRFNIRRYFMV